MVEKPTNLDSQLPKAKSEKSPLGDISETKARGELLRDALEQPGTDFDRSRARRTMEVAFRDEPKKSEDGKPQQAKDEAKPADVKADTSISAQEQTKRDAAVKEANDGIERGNLLRTDSIAGSWSPRSQETWKKLFDDISKQPGMTADEAVIALNEAGVAINSQLEKAKSPYTVGMAVQKGADGKTTFTMQLNSDQTKEANRVALAEGKDIPTSLRVGSMDTVSKPDATKDSKKDQGGLAGTDYPRNAAGAYVKMGAYNKPELIVHKDGTKIVPQWESHKDGKPAVLRSYDETSADGKQTRTWNREGDNFTALGADGKKLVVKNVEFDKSNNGNMSFSDVNGRSFVMRGTGAVIPTGQDFPRFEFDKQGRIASIIPTTAEWNKGAPSLGFSYENDKTDKIYQIGTLTKSEQAKGSQGTRRALKPGEMLADNGDIRTPEVVSFNSKNFSGTRVHRPGTAFAADDRQVPFVEDNKLASIAHFNTQNTFVGVEGFSKDGQLLKTYTRENITVKGADGKVALRNQIIEIDHIAGNTTKWTTQADNKFHGTRTIEGGKPVNIDQGIRQNIGFNNLAVLDYTDDKGEWHTEFKDGRKEIGRDLGNGAYNVTDEHGQLVKAGLMRVVQNGNAVRVVPDLNNYLSYKHEMADGKPALAKVDIVHDGKPKEGWTPAKGQAQRPSPNGELTYENADGQKVVLRPDLSESKYTKGKAGELDRLAAINFPDGSNRSFEYGEPADAKHPTKIVSTSIDASGDSLVRTFSAMPPADDGNKPVPAEPVVPQAVPADPMPSATDKAAAAQAELTKAQAKMNDALSAVQLWTMTDEKITATKTDTTSGLVIPGKTEKIEVKAAPVFALELLANGDFEATSTATDNARYLFPSRRMAEYPRGIVVPLDGPDGRVVRAQQNFNSVYTEQIFSEERKSMPARQMIDGRLVLTASMTDKDPIMTTFSQKYMAEQLGITMPKMPADIRALSKPQQDQLFAELAYKYELAASIIEGRKLKAKK